ncbi:MAG: hypothetical protein KF832_17095 [Caldilineaceae bacterium]|nr:hypothetical protein [Caldilineaceae bacterium]
MATQWRMPQSLAEQQALAQLGSYVGSARRHGQLTRAALAQKVGKTEVEIYALEHGLLPYQELHRDFVSNLAAALDEAPETFLLLLGQPKPVAHPRRSPEAESLWLGSKRRITEVIATNSKRVDNGNGYWQRHNRRYQRSLNLIDSSQAGRLISRLWTGRLAKQYGSLRGSIIIAALVCLLLICVNTYSLSNRFGTQSEGQASTLSTQLIVSPTHEASDRYLLDSMTVISGALPHQPAKAMTKAIVYPEVAAYPASAQTATAGVHLSSAVIEVQRCDIRVAGRFALCRI